MESWDLKLDRAVRHAEEVECVIRRFSDEHSYQAVDTGFREGNWRKYLLRFTAQPDPMLPVIVGDVVHNIRSALDHVVVASVPRDRRRQAGFPIFYTRPYDEGGLPLDNDEGKGWAKLTTGLPDPILTLVKALQPFQVPEQRVIDFCAEYGLNTSDLSALAILGRLGNADKHRELVTIAYGLDTGAIVAIHHDGSPTVEHVTETFCKDGAELMRVDFSEPPVDTKLRVEVRGTVMVGVEVRKERGITRIPSTLHTLIKHVRAITEVIWDLRNGRVPHRP